MNLNTCKIISALRNSEGKYIDDHNGKETTSNVFVVYVNGNGDEHLCWAGDTEYFCLNPMVLAADGTVHLSRNSVGSVVKVEKHGGLEAAVQFHNDDQMDVKWNKQKPKITKIFRLSDDIMVGELMCMSTETARIEDLQTLLTEIVDILDLPSMEEVYGMTMPAYEKASKECAVAAGIDLDDMNVELSKVDTGEPVFPTHQVAAYIVQSATATDAIKERARKYLKAA